MAATGGGAEIASAPEIKTTIAPNTALTSAFEDGFARFKAAQTAIKTLR